MPEKRIVAIVDDDEAVREALEDSLLSFGYESRTFASAEDYLASHDGSEIACILTDVKMPGMSGIEMQSILNRGADPKPIIFFSSHDDVRVQEKALKAGARAFLKKPVMLGELIDNVDTIMKAA